MKYSKLRSRWIKSALLNFAGVCLALVIAEICLSPFASGKGSVPGPDETLAGDTFTANAEEERIFEIKQFQEGFAVSHFAYDGRRLTGNTEIVDAPSGIVIGDSYVEALQVGDAKTMGANIERLALSNHTPVNVRQYGWGGTSSATYLAVANELNRKWKPNWVAVIFNDDDFTQEAFATGRFWRMEIDPSKSAVKLVRVPRTGSNLDPWLARIGLRSVDLRSWLGKSSLAYLATEKYFLSAGQPNGHAATVSSSDLEIKKQEDTVRALLPEFKKAYPQKLIIVFVPQIAVDSGRSPQVIERILSSVCNQEGIEFVSTRSAMIDARDQEHTLSEGFVNTIPGLGHLNPLGHQIVANEIWRAITKGQHAK